MLSNKTSRLSALLLAITALSAFGPAPTQAQQTGRTFPETGKTVSGQFLEYWDTHGGLAQQGYPITDLHTEISDTDGKAYTMQYFERAVFESHPEYAPPNDVLLSLLGVFRYKQRYPGPGGAPNQVANAEPGAYMFSETGKTVGGSFLAYWKSHGGLAQQGFPISDEFQERSQTDGKTYNIQYFERSVFEYHPENVGTPYEVLLSLLGSYEYNQRHAATDETLVLPPPRPGFRQWDPHGSGSYLTWTEMSYPAPGEDHVMALNLVTGQVTAVTNKTGRQDGEDLSGSLVLWKDQGLCPTPCSKSDIYATDLASGQLYEIAGAVGSEYNGEARISGHTVAWLAYVDSNPTILMRDLDTGLTTTVARSEPLASGGMYFAHLAVSDDYVAWDGIVPRSGGKAGDDQPYQIRVYARQTGEVRTVAGGPVASYEPGPDLTLSGDRLVWLDTRLHVADLSTGATSMLPLQDGDSPVLRGDLLVWHGQHTILAAHLGDSEATPVKTGDLTTDYGAPTLAGGWVVWETEIGVNAGRLGTRSLADVFDLPASTPPVVMRSLATIPARRSPRPFRLTQMMSVANPYPVAVALA